MGTFQNLIKIEEWCRKWGSMLKVLPRGFLVGPMDCCTAIRLSEDLVRFV